MQSLSGRPARSLEIVHDHLGPERLTLVDELQMHRMILIIVLRLFALKLDA